MLKTKCFAANRAPAVAPPSAMSRMLLARIAAAKEVLQRSHEDDFAAQSKIQCNAILEQIQREGLQPEQSAELAVLIEEVPFMRVYKTALLEAIGAKGAPISDRRRKQQDFTCALGFFMECQWGVWGAKDCNPLSVRNGIISHLLHLNCVNPNESTMKFFASLWMLLTEGPTRALYELSEADKANRRDSLKQEFHKMKVRSPNSTNLPYVLECWATPEDLKLEHSELYERVFAQGDPVKPPISVDALLQLNLSYGCRGGGKGARGATTALSVVAPTSSRADTPDGSMQQLAGFFMEGLTKMAEQQQKMFQALYQEKEIPLRYDRQQGPGTMEVQSHQSNALLKRLNTAEGSLTAHEQTGQAYAALGDHGAPMPLPASAQALAALAPAPAPALAGATPGDGAVVATPALAPSVAPPAPAPGPADAIPEDGVVVATPAPVPVAAPSSHGLLGALVEREQDKKRKRIMGKTPDPPRAVAAAPIAATPAKKHKRRTPEQEHTPVEAAAPKGVRFAMPKIDFEGSRHQYLGRTGFRGPGGSTKFIYSGEGKAYDSKGAAKKAATDWLKDIYTLL
jgi:hypothetical protein